MLTSTSSGAALTNAEVALMDSAFMLPMLGSYPIERTPYLNAKPNACVKPKPPLYSASPSVTLPAVKYVGWIW